VTCPLPRRLICLPTVGAQYTTQRSRVGYGESCRWIRYLETISSDDDYGNMNHATLVYSRSSRLRTEIIIKQLQCRRTWISSIFV